MADRVVRTCKSKLCSEAIASYEPQDKIYCSSCERGRKNLRVNIAIGMAWWFFGAVAVGAINALHERSLNGTGCVYKSLASFTSPGYILGCELFRKRFEYGK